MMMAAMRLYVLLAILIAICGKCAAESTPEDCGEEQHNVENGMIRLPDFSGESFNDLNCSWTYTAPPGRKLLVKVDSVHLPPQELRTTQFQLYIDEKFYDIPRNCVKCLRDMAAGKVLKVIFTSYITPFTDHHLTNFTEVSTANTDGIGSFQIRYKAFDPHRCGRPEQIENGFLVNKGRKVGQSIFYHCNPPYDLIGDSELHCVTTAEKPVPEWDNKTPKCLIQDCTGEPVVRKDSSGAIASPGYPSYIYQFSAPCLWEVVAQPNQQIKVSITYLKFPKTVDNSFYENTSRLSLLDSDSYIVNLTESLINGPLNFTTLTNKLTVELIVTEDLKRKEESGFFMEYSTVSTSCPKPTAPENGEVIAFSNELGSTVAYRCTQGFVLVGELHSECVLNGQWSHPTPKCEPLNVNVPPFIAASNDSDIVTAKLSEIPVVPESTKQLKNGKKKATELASTKDGLNFSDTKEKTQVPKNNKHSESYPVQSENDKTSEITAKKSEKESGNGPKSEPHLLQVVPPKEQGKKTSEEPVTSGHETSVVNATEKPEPIPTLDTGYNQEIDFGSFKLSLTMIYIIAGVGLPIIIAIIILVILLVYRRRYPVRMRFGRKFSTFENPMYVTKDAQHPRELKRLTA